MVGTLPDIVATAAPTDRDGVEEIGGLAVLATLAD
jgi:hypothetical protein